MSWILVGGLLARLKALTRLRRLDVRGCEFLTAKDVKQLMKELPQLTVER